MRIRNDHNHIGIFALIRIFATTPIITKKTGQCIPDGRQLPHELKSCLTDGTAVLLAVLVYLFESLLPPGVKTSAVTVGTIIAVTISVRSVRARSASAEIRPAGIFATVGCDHTVRLGHGEPAAHNSRAPRQTHKKCDESKNTKSIRFHFSASFCAVHRAARAAPRAQQTKNEWHDQKVLRIRASRRKSQSYSD